MDSDSRLALPDLVHDQYVLLWQDIQFVYRMAEPENRFKSLAGRHE